MYFFETIFFSRIFIFLKRKEYLTVTKSTVNFQFFLSQHIIVVLEIFVVGFAG